MLTDSTQNRADGVQKRAYIFTITRSSYALIIIGRKKHYSAWNVGNNQVGGVYYHFSWKKIWATESIIYCDHATECIQWKRM